MRQIVLLSVVIASLSTVVGCGAHAPKQTATPTSAATYSALDCTPPPGGDMQFSFDDAPKAAARSNTAATSFRPNVQERPTRGAIHAAY